MFSITSDYWLADQLQKFRTENSREPTAHELTGVSKSFRLQTTDLLLLRRSKRIEIRETIFRLTLGSVLL
jgi:hypothetical protein